MISDKLTHSFIRVCSHPQMLTALNGQERSLSHMRNLLRSCGWEIVKVTQSGTVGQLFALVGAKAV